MKRVVNCAVRGLGILVAVLWFVHSAVAAPLPLVAGNYQIAYDFFHGDTHLLLFGDSLQNGSVGLYPSRWHVDKYVGQVAGPNLGETFIGDTGSYYVEITGVPYIASNSSNYYASDTPPDGVTGTSPGHSNHVVFAAAPTVPDTNLTSNRILEVSLAPSQDSTYFSGKWADRSTGQIQADLLLYANPQGVTGGVQFDVYLNSITTPIASIPISTYSNTSGIIKQTVTFPAQAWTPGSSIRGVFRLTPGTTAQAGTNLITDAIRYSTGEKGFQFANIATGGIDIDYYLNPAFCSDQTLQQYVQGTDTNTCFIWLGQNDAGTYNAAQFKTKLQSLMARYRGARADMRFILCATYDTGNPVLADYARDMYEISQDDSNTLFINLYQSAGDFAFLNANYLADSVHQNTAGNFYFVDKTESLLVLAAAQAPEPGTLGMIAIGVSLSFIRRTRRPVQ